MVPQPFASLRNRSPIDSPSYALRADLADRLAGQRQVGRGGGGSLGDAMGPRGMPQGRVAHGEEAPSSDASA